MVKANAYGHGDIQVVKYLESNGASRFGVGLVEEGLRLRQLGKSRSEILVFGFTGKEAIEEMMAHCLTPVVSDWQQLEDLKKLVKKEFHIHLKINTGMNRLGFTINDVPKLLETITQMKTLKILGIGTHLMSSDDISTKESKSQEQLKKFQEVVDKYNLSSYCLHAYNTMGAILAMEDKTYMKNHVYGLRPGLGLFGHTPVQHDLSRNLKPVMTLKSKVVALQKINKGQVVSYGGTWKATSDATIGVVPIGYADGIPTQLSNQGCVVAEEKKLPIVGRVCMDYTLIDVSQLQKPLGQEVEFFGAKNDPHQVAETAGTIIYDIFTRVSERVPRVFMSGEK